MTPAIVSLALPLVLIATAAGALFALAMTIRSHGRGDVDGDEAAAKNAQRAIGFYLLAVAVVAGGLLRFGTAGRYTLNTDELVTSLASRTIWRLEGLTYELLSPLYEYLTSFVLMVLPPNEFTIRLVSVVSGTAAPAVLYLLMLRLFKSHLVAGVASLLLALNPLHIETSLFCRRYGIFAFLTLASYCVLFEALTKQTWRWFLGWGAVTSLGIMSSLTYGFVVLAQILWAVFYMVEWKDLSESRFRIRLRWRVIGGCVAAGALCILLYAPQLRWNLKHARWLKSFTKAHGSMGADSRLYTPHFYYKVGSMFVGEWFVVLGRQNPVPDGHKHFYTGALVLAAFGFATWMRRRPKMSLCLLGQIGGYFGYCHVTGLHAFTPAYVANHIAFFSAGMALGAVAAAEGAGRLFARSERLRLHGPQVFALAALAVYVGIVGAEVRRYFRSQERIAGRGWREVADFTFERAGRGDFVVYPKGGTGTAQDFYVRQMGRKRCESLAINDFDGVLRPGVNLWLWYSRAYEPGWSPPISILPAESFAMETYGHPTVVRYTIPDTVRELALPGRDFETSAPVPMMSPELAAFWRVRPFPGLPHWLVSGGGAVRLDGAAHGRGFLSLTPKLKEGQRVLAHAFTPEFTVPGKAVLFVSLKSRGEKNTLASNKLSFQHLYLKVTGAGPKPTVLYPVFINMSVVERRRWRSYGFWWELPETSRSVRITVRNTGTLMDAPLHIDHVRVFLIPEARQAE